MAKHDYVIGIDQSYTRTGITILKNKEVVEMFSLDFKGCKTNTEKRKLLSDILNSFINELDSDNILILTERIRLRSQGFLSEK